jgi:hypothetical protein
VTLRLEKLGSRGGDELTVRVQRRSGDAYFFPEVKNDVCRSVVLIPGPGPLPPEGPGRSPRCPPYGSALVFALLGC